MIALRSYSVLPLGARAEALAVRETGPGGAPKPRLLDRVRQAPAGVRSPADRMFLS